MTLIDLNNEQTIYTGPPNRFVGEMLTAYFKVKYADIPTMAGAIEDQKGVIGLANSEGEGTLILVLSDAGKPAGKRLLTKTLKQLMGD